VTENTEETILHLKETNAKLRAMLEAVKNIAEAAIDAYQDETNQDNTGPTCLWHDLQKALGEEEVK
jgi:hypothetical protein